MDDDLKLVERLNVMVASPRVSFNYQSDCDDVATAAATIIRLVKERDEAQEGLDRLEAAYGALSDDVFFAYPKITAMAKELSEAQAGEMRAIAREVYERLRAETAEAQRDAALEALRPFAEAEKLTNPHDRVAVVNVSDLRAASRAGGGE